jgi:acyl-CoA reductase-like NAD-dependent aldehyde dehydrogenase
VYQAEHVATQLLHNAGYNCNAAKVLILPEQWSQADEFLDLVADKIASRPRRPAYYPGSQERYDRIVEGGGVVRTLGGSATGVPPTMIAVDAGNDHPAFTEEAFCRIMATVRLSGDDPASFLAEAVSFCNERLRGTLNVTVIVDPDTLRAEARSVEQAIDGLHYGTVSLNLWAAAGFPLGVTPWGAYPGHSLDDIGSGIGFVHNARLIDRPEKTVIRAPFIHVPKPTWSAFHRNADKAVELATRFESAPSVVKLPALLAAAVRA